MIELLLTLWLGLTAPQAAIIRSRTAGGERGPGSTPRGWPPRPARRRTGIWGRWLNPRACRWEARARPRGRKIPSGVRGSIRWDRNLDWPRR